MPLRLDGTEIQRIRQSHDLSREKLARLADVSTSTIIRMEREDADVGAGIAARVAVALGVSMEEIFTDEAVA